MTVAALIEKLKEMPQDAMVVVRGYEDGVDEVDCIKECEVLTDYYEESYYGAHEIVSDGLLSFGTHSEYDVTEESPGLYRFSEKLSYDESFYKSANEFYCKLEGAVSLWSSMQGYSRAERQELRESDIIDISE